MSELDLLKMRADIGMSFQEKAAQEGISAGAIFAASFAGGALSLRNVRRSRPARSATSSATAWR